MPESSPWSPSRAYRSLQQRRRRGLVLALVVALGVAGLGGVYAYTQSYVGQVRTYYIAAHEEEWNYTPFGYNAINITYLSSSREVAYYTTRNATYLGTSFLKCVYQQYTDGRFSQEVARTGDQLYLGILGPLIYAVVGDSLQVHFRNECRFPEAIHPLGVYYPTNAPATPYNATLPEREGGLVPPGMEYNYTWSVSPAVGPSGTGEGSVLWPYFSGPSMSASSNTGLMGPIIVSAPGEANPDGSPADVQVNLVILAATLNESSSPYFAYNIAHDALDPTAVDPNDPLWSGSLVKHALNGFLYGNLYAPQLRWGEAVRWYVFSPDSAISKFTWEGNLVWYGGTGTSIVPLSPGTVEVADMDLIQNGSWLFGSANASDVAAGMQAWYQVSVPPGSFAVPVPGLPLVPKAPSAARVGGS